MNMMMSEVDEESQDYSKKTNQTPNTIFAPISVEN